MKGRRFLQFLPMLFFLACLVASCMTERSVTRPDAHQRELEERTRRSCAGLQVKMKANEHCEWSF